MDLDPTRRAGHILAVVLCPPALDEAHADCAHLGQVVDCLKAVVDRLTQQSRKLLVVENLQGASWRDLAHRGWVEAVVVVAVAALDEDAAVTEAFSKHLAPNIVQVDP